MTIKNLVRVLIISMLICTANGCDSPSSPPPRLLWFVAVNSTDQEFTDVAIVGEGYPGEFGYLVPSGHATMGWYSERLDDHFEVVWRDDDELHRKSFALPSNYSMVDRDDLVVEFMPDGQIDVYARRRPSRDRKE